MTHTEFLAGMTYLAAGVGKVVPAEQCIPYWDLLGHLPYEVFQAAAKRALLGVTENFLPPAGVIYRHACDVMIRLRHEQERQARLEHDRSVLPAQVQRLLNGIGRLPGGKS